MTNLPSNSGGTLEGTVKSVLSGKGFEILNYREWEKDKKAHSEEILLTHVPFQTIYEHPGRTEFLLKSKKYNLEIRIECKWQQVAGSVDEKLPYLYLNVIEKMPEQNIMILIDGTGWKAGAIKWLKKAVEEKKYTAADNRQKNIQVLSLGEFLTWANQIFR